MKKFKVTYSKVASYREDVVSEKFGIPYIETIEHVGEVLDGYEDLGYNSYKEALERANELKRISNKQYTNIKVLEYDDMN